MDWVTFGLLLYDNLPLYISILAGSLMLYIVLFRKSYISFLDPYIFNLIYSVFGFSVVIFLYATKSIEVKYLYSYLLTQGAFFAGLFAFKPLNKSRLVGQNIPRINFEEEGILMKVLFLITAVAFFFAQVISYKLVGIPLLLESRTGAYADSGGLGLLGRIIDVLRPATTFMLIYFIFKPGKSFLFKLWLTLFGMFLMLTFALSGSKSLFMSAGFILFIYLLLNAGQLKKNVMSLHKYERYIIIAGLIFAFFTIVIQSGNNSTDNSSISVFLYRLVASGDTYYFAYPNHNIETINGSKSFLALFGDIFSVLRIVPRDKQPGVLGIQLFQMFSDSDLITGPNARHNVFGYIYYGFYGSIAFSLIIGLLLGFVRNKLFFVLRTNILGQLTFMFLYINLTLIETDPPVAISGLENILLIFPVFVVSAIILYVPFYNIKHQKIANSVK